jgi:hypothetical protein
MIKLKKNQLKIIKILPTLPVWFAIGGPII